MREDIKRIIKKRKKCRAGKMAQWLRALPALPKVLSSVQFPATTWWLTPSVMRSGSAFWPADIHADRILYT